MINVLLFVKHPLSTRHFVCMLSSNANDLSRRILPYYIMYKEVEA